MAKILIIDDDEVICENIERLVQSLGHETTCVFRLKEGLERLSKSSFDLVLLDVMMPDGNGLEAVPKIKERPDAPEIIIMTAGGDPDGAERAIRSGAWDYIQKPDSVECIRLPLIRALQYRVDKATRKTPVLLRREGIIANSQQMKTCFDLVAKAGLTHTSVLIIGETGTGKELFAKAIHENSPRSKKALVIVDCGALPETLVESMLFGHEKGAFTGADRSREGLIKQADGGTLFLDEVGELPITVQSSFLRVLQEHRFRPVGGGKEIRSDFRLIAATNRDLEQMALEGLFRRDFLFRLQQIVIDLPPLRDRTEDIKDIAFYYMDKFCDRYGIGTKGISPEFLEALVTYDWPGNVRELMNAVERALSIARDEPTLFPIHLPPHIRTRLAREAVEPRPPAEFSLHRTHGSDGDVPKLREVLAHTEKSYLENIIEMADGDVKEACRVSGLSRSRFYDRLKKYHILRPS